MSTTPYAHVNLLLSEAPPTRLYHYTDAGGLEGIFRTKTIRATEAAFLNDEAEIDHARMYIQNCIENNKRRDIKILDVDNTFLEILHNKSGSIRPGVFVCSFSEERDQLSQWRAYAGGQDGYSIGFPSDRLRQSAQNAGFTLAKCTYDHAMQYKICQDIVLFFLGKFETSGRTLSEAEAISDQISVEISKYGPLIKHRAFSEEKEWRVFSPQIPIGDSRINFKISGGRIVPYVNIDFCSDMGCLGGPPAERMQVIAGPSSRYSENAYAMQALLHKHIGAGVGMGRSEAPFRT